MLCKWAFDCVSTPLTYRWRQPLGPLLNIVIPMLKMFSFRINDKERIWNLTFHLNYIRNSQEHSRSNCNKWRKHSCKHNLQQDSNTWKIGVNVGWQIAGHKIYNLNLLFKYTYFTWFCINGTTCPKGTYLAGTRCRNEVDTMS